MKISRSHFTGKPQVKNTKDISHEKIKEQIIHLPSTYGLGEIYTALFLF